MYYSTKPIYDTLLQTQYLYLLIELLKIKFINDIYNCIYNNILCRSSIKSIFVNFSFKSLITVREIWVQIKQLIINFFQEKYNKDFFSKFEK